jgi:hypothetical protein
VKDYRGKPRDSSVSYTHARFYPIGTQEHPGVCIAFDPDSSWMRSSVSFWHEKMHYLIVLSQAKRFKKELDSRKVWTFEDLKKAFLHYARQTNEIN